MQIDDEFHYKLAIRLAIVVWIATIVALGVRFCVYLF